MANLQDGGKDRENDNMVFIIRETGKKFNKKEFITEGINTAISIIHDEANENNVIAEDFVSDEKKLEGFINNFFLILSVENGVPTDITSEILTKAISSFMPEFEIEITEIA
jgi:hypothetical protein